jgi:hypothetical protein
MVRPVSQNRQVFILAINILESYFDIHTKMTIRFFD